MLANRVYAVAFQTVRDYLLSFDTPFEIAKYANENGPNKTHKIILSLNLDKERLEKDFRLFYVIRKIDQNAAF